MTDSVFDQPLDLPSGEGPLPPIDWNEFKKVVETRRSVRVFDRTPVPEADVREALDLALLAPNSSNLQPWEFHWVRTPKMRAALVEACLSQPAAKTAAAGRTSHAGPVASETIVARDQTQMVFVPRYAHVMAGDESPAECARSIFESWTYIR